MTTATGSANAVNVGVDVRDHAPAAFRDAAGRARGLPVDRHWQESEPRAKGR